MRSNTEQHEENQEASDERNWRLGRAYEDVGSASRYSDKAREGYDELIGDLEADRFNAQILILWTNSRGSRRVGEWVLLIELCEERGVLIFVTSHDRLYDPANPHDRSNLIDQANKAELFSAELSKAISRAQRSNAKAGKPHGRINFGFRREYRRDPDNPKKMIVEQIHDKQEAKLVRELFDRLDGRGRYARGKAESLRAISVDWTERGIVSRTGKPFPPEHLRTMVLRHAYAGLRIHEPGVKLITERVRSQRLHKAQWKAIVPVAKFWRVYRRLTDPGRRTSKPGRGKHLLSMIALCDPCGGPLTGTQRDRGKVKCGCGASVAITRKMERGEATCGRCKAQLPPQQRKPGKRQYICHVNGCVTVSEAELDELAEVAVLAFLSVSANVERLTADEEAEERAVAAQAEVVGIQRELDDLRLRLGAGRLSAETAEVAEPEILTRLGKAQKRAKELATPSALRALLSPGEDVELRWQAADMAIKREVMRLLLRPSMVGELRVTRRPSRGSGLVPAKDRVEWVID